MKKILLPLFLGTLPASIIPIGSSCSSKQQNVGVVPFEYLNITEDNTLNGFKDGVDLSGYDTLLIPSTVEKIGFCSFYNPHLDKTTIPDNIANLEFEKTYDSQSHIVFGKLHTIDNRAFYKAPIKKVTLPYGLRTIKDFAFSKSNLEECYFPPYLNTIGEQAFSYTNLGSVLFNGVFDETGQKNDHFPPWMREDAKGINNDSYVKYVGKKAFYNCKNLINHKITPYVEAYQLDSSSGESGIAQSPFAQCNDAGESVGSNLKILDFTQVPLTDGYEHLGTDGRNKFGVEMLDQPAENDRCIVVNSSALLVGKPYSNYVTAIGNCFGQTLSSTDLSQVIYMKNWLLHREDLFNFVFDCDRATGSYSKAYDPIYEIETSSETNQIKLKMNPFTNAYPDFFPNDTTIDLSIKSWDGQEEDCPEVAAKILCEGNGYNLIFDFGNLSTKIIGKTLTMTATFASKKLGISYTFGEHYKTVGTQYQELDSIENNPIRFTFTA